MPEHPAGTPAIHMFDFKSAGVDMGEMPNASYSAGSACYFNGLETLRRSSLVSPMVSQGNVSGESVKL